MRLQTLLFGLLVCLLSWQTEARAHFMDESVSVEQILALMDQRLLLMPSVAAWKWKNAKGPTDAKRAQVVTDHALAQAAPLGLQPDAVRHLFEFQIALATSVEETLQEGWRQKGFDYPQPIPSLDTELRPRLDRLTGDLLLALYRATPALAAADFTSKYAALAEARLLAKGWTDETRAAALKALAPIRLDSTPALERIEASKLLRVGTTGDYAPFSLESDGNLTGADIELAQSLASALGAEPVFVRTTWPMLLEDLQRGKFDIALAGISVTPERQAVGAFSLPYHSGGKTTLSRCRDVRHFNDLKAVDRRGVRVIVNPGGTNAQYVREHIHGAHVVAFPDNRRVFEEISAGRADVMITDDVEADLQAQRHPDLCRAMPGTLTHADKAVLLLKDPALVAKVNAWLADQLKRGEPARLLREAGASVH